MKHEPFPSTPLPVAEAAKPAPPATAASRRQETLEMPIIVAATTVVLGFAWFRRNEGDLTAETGLGYALGIIGGLMMLVLLVYPLRKRLRALRFIGDIPSWFRIHMLLGILGPVLVVLHSNFSLGSLNSKAAMLSMLVVAGSGFIGRFLYSRIHRGLYGQKQSVRDQLSEVEQVRARLCGTGPAVDTVLGADVVLQLTRYQSGRLTGSAGFLGSFKRTMTGPFSRSRLRAKLIADVRKGARDAGPAASKLEEQKFTEALDRYFLALGRAEAFTLYERSFAAWHLLHLPLFAILILATIAHVIAVHLY